MQFDFEIPPTPKARPRIGRYGGKTPYKTAVVEAKIKASAIQQMGEDGVVIQIKKGQFVEAHMNAYDKPVGVQMMFTHADRRRRDIDNCAKLVLDALNEIAWKDDYLVKELILENRYDDVGSIKARVYRLDCSSVAFSQSGGWWVSGNPKPKERPRRGKTGQIYTPDSTQTWEYHYRTMTMTKNHPQIPSKAIGAVFLVFRGDRRRVDIDNILKALMDALNGAAYTDDSQIDGVAIRLHHNADNPGVYTQLHEFEQFKDLVSGEFQYV